jgi:NAD(P)-dependent dehydrogenase (short-subunit alcohol dehydrogenase family)
MNNPLDYRGQVALVTGAASGMGLAPAQAFAVKVINHYGDEVLKVYDLGK